MLWCMMGRMYAWRIRMGGFWIAGMRATRSRKPGGHHVGRPCACAGCSWYRQPNEDTSIGAMVHDGAYVRLVCRLRMVSPPNGRLIVCRGHTSEDVASWGTGLADRFFRL